MKKLILAQCLSRQQNPDHRPAERDLSPAGSVYADQVRQCSHPDPDRTGGHPDGKRGGRTHPQEPGVHQDRRQDQGHKARPSTSTYRNVDGRVYEISLEGKGDEVVSTPRPCRRSARRPAKWVLKRRHPA